MASHEVILYTKPGCCLCDAVKAQLRALQPNHSFDLHEINIQDDPEAHERFKNEIPVVFIDGKKAFKYHLDERQFLKRLDRGTHHAA
jgi:glutaredoxin